MYRFFFLILTLFLQVQLLFAGTADSIKSRRYHELSAGWDNDALLNTDCYYTQGLMAQLVLPCLERNPLNHLFFQIKNASHYYGMAVVQEMFTPKNIMESIVDPNDRPYAGTLYFRSLKVSNNDSANIKLTSQLDLGVLGPASGAGYIQNIIHEINGLPSPKGWSNQIKNMPYINYNVMIDKGVAESPDLMELIWSGGVRVGNVYDDILFGLKFRTGLVNNYFNGVSIQDRTVGSNKDIQAYFFGGINGNVVLYNALLTGGLFGSESSDVLNNNEISHFVLSGNAGIFLGYHGIGAKFELYGQSPEIIGGQPHGWCRVSGVISF